jgi:Uma2 family endonuclease
MTAQLRHPPGKYKLTVDDFLRLDETGVFGTTRTELIDGDIIIMNAEYRPHGRIRDELHFRLRRALEDMGSELLPLSASVALMDHSMPLPDIVLTDEPYGDGPIPLGSIALIVEVSASTLHRDTNEKLSMYASARVPEYWAVDVSGRKIICWSAPNGSAFESHTEIMFGGPITCVTIPGLTIATDAL